MKIRLAAHKVESKDIIASWNDSFFSDVQEAGIDDATRTIKGVCVFGKRESLNGYTYQDAAINTLTKLTDQAKFYINHPSKSEQKERDGVRDIRDWAGVFTSPHRIGDKVLANLTVREAFWPLVKDVATMKPFGIGNSINSRVKVFKGSDGKESIVDIDQLRSVDLVASAATTQNLFEGHPEIEDLPEIEEGLLADKIREEKKQRKIRDLNWQTESLISCIVMGEKDEYKNLSIEEKKKAITDILTDLDSEIKKVMSEKATVDESTIKKEDEDMDFKLLKIEDLTKERPDIVQAIKASIEDAERITKIEKDLEAASNENKTIKVTVEKLQKENEDLKKERDTLKTKLDELETKEKKAVKEAFISKTITKHKLPADAISETFKQDLILKDEAGIEAAIIDRINLWTKGAGKPKGMGDEFDPTKINLDKKEGEVDKVVLESAKSKFLA